MVYLYSLSISKACICHAQSGKVNIDSFNGEYQGDCGKGKAANGVDLTPDILRMVTRMKQENTSGKTVTPMRTFRKMDYLKGERTLYKVNTGKPDSNTVFKGFWEKSDI